MSEWFMPRALAGLSAFALILAVVYPLLGKFIAVGPLLFAAALGGWTSHEMSDTIRERHLEKHRHRRRMTKSVNVWVLPSPRVSVTPAEPLWPAGGWNPRAVETPEYDGDIRRVAEQR